MESNLPWIVAYGKWVWVATLVATMVAVPWHIWLRRRRIARAERLERRNES